MVKTEGFRVQLFAPFQQITTVVLEMGGFTLILLLITCTEVIERSPAHLSGVKVFKIHDQHLWRVLFIPYYHVPEIKRTRDI